MLSHDTNNWLRHITFNGENKTVEISKHFDNFWNQIYKYEMPKTWTLTLCWINIQNL